LTYKKAPGQPQYRATFSDWSLAPALEDTMFAVEAPDGAQKVAFVAQLPRLSSRSRKPPADKGPK
jgi:hypothetical protein